MDSFGGKFLLNLFLGDRRGLPGDKMTCCPQFTAGHGFYLAQLGQASHFVPEAWMLENQPLLLLRASRRVVNAGVRRVRAAVASVRQGGGAGAACSNDKAEELTSRVLEEMSSRILVRQRLARWRRL